VRHGENTCPDRVRRSRIDLAKAAGWEATASAFDSNPARHAVMEEAGVVAAATADDALGGAGLVLSLVTADSALAVAQDHAGSSRRAPCSAT
jgi:3-hydroxyisobutyrate dehydrogenase-like beta-hydroxyacid dehydrogenase